MDLFWIAFFHIINMKCPISKNVHLICVWTDMNKLYNLDIIHIHNCSNSEQLYDLKPVNWGPCYYTWMYTNVGALIGYEHFSNRVSWVNAPANGFQIHLFLATLTNQVYCLVINIIMFNWPFWREVYYCSVSHSWRSSRTWFSSIRWPLSPKLDKEKYLYWPNKLNAHL